MARRSAVQALYQWAMTGQDAADIITSFIENDALKGKHKEYFNSLIEIIPVYIEQIDELVDPFLDRDREKVDPLEQAILRLGAYELEFSPDIPARVVIDEAVDIAKAFCSDNGYRFVNGVLDKIAATTRPNEFATPDESSS
ncbi:MAG: transcription antitermination factor NusB [Pseudomonadota bacterium]